jgi:hypothetical protein
MVVAPSALALATVKSERGRPPDRPPCKKPFKRFLFSANGVFQAADRVLDLTLDLVSLSLTFRFGVAGGLAGPFFSFTLCLLGCAFDAILINHFYAPSIFQLVERFGARDVS